MATALTLLTRDDVAGTSLADCHYESKTQTARGAVNAALGAANGLVSGSAQIAIAASSVTVNAAALGGSYGGKPVYVAINEATEDTTLFRLRYAWSGNDLVIHGNANATAIVDVTYMVDSRA